MILVRTTCHFLKPLFVAHPWKSYAYKFSTNTTILPTDNIFFRLTLMFRPNMLGRFMSYMQPLGPV